jgi:hypothetical protein
MKEHISLLGATFLESIMMKGDSGGTIPKDVTLKLAPKFETARKPNCLRSAGACVKFSKGEHVRMCFSSRPDNRGYGLVNKRYDLDSAAGRSWNLQTPMGKDICHAFELTILKHALFSKIHD